MKTIIQFVLSLRKAFEALGICATVGFIAGGLSGLLLTIYAMNLSPAPVLSAAEIWQVALVLWATTSLFLLFYLYVFCRYALGSIFLPVLVNCLLTCVLTVWLVNVTGLWGWAFFVGALTGILIGRLLCILCHFFYCKAYGMHRTSTEMRVR